MRSVRENSRDRQAAFIFTSRGRDTTTQNQVKQKGAQPAASGKTCGQLFLLVKLREPG
jgi:hypothetical protein